MFTNNHIPISLIRFHPLKYRSAPTPLFKYLTLFLTCVYCFLVFPALEVTWLIWLMEPIVDWNFVRACSSEEGKYMGHCIRGFQRFFEHAIHLSFWGDK